jgi:hypothetical protein
MLCPALRCKLVAALDDLAANELRRVSLALDAAPKNLRGRQHLDIIDLPPTAAGAG